MSAPPRYTFSVVELQGPTWSQGELLSEGEGTAAEIGAVIARDLDALIQKCNTGAEDGETYEPALEINITRQAKKRAAMIPTYRHYKTATPYLSVQEAIVAILDAAAGVLDFDDSGEPTEPALFGGFEVALGAILSADEEPAAKILRETTRNWSYDKEDAQYFRPCPECGRGPLDLKGYGAVCPVGHVMPGE